VVLVSTQHAPVERGSNRTRWIVIAAIGVAIVVAVILVIAYGGGGGGGGGGY
jgi:ABC-type transporter Mla subunit MlaD